MRTFPASIAGRCLHFILAAAVFPAWPALSHAADPEREKTVRTVKAFQSAKDHDAAVACLRERLAASREPWLEALLADALFQAGRKDEALAAVEALCEELERKERGSKRPEALEVFLDGEREAGGPFPAWSKDIVRLSWLVGAAGADPPITGQIDEVALFRRALSEKEIRALHGLGKSGKSLAE